MCRFAPGEHVVALADGLEWHRVVDEVAEGSQASPMVSEEEAAAAGALLGKCMLARRLGPHDRADAAQEAVYRWLPWRHSHAEASPHAAIAMLLGIHRNVVRELRRARRLLPIEALELESPSVGLAGEARGEKVDDLEQVRRWLTARGLAGVDADLLLVRFGRGIEWEPAAAELGVANVAAAKKRIERFLSREGLRRSFHGRRGEGGFPSLPFPHSAMPKR